VYPSGRAVAIASLTAYAPALSSWRAVISPI
jgi:hypothetical protein